MEKGDKGSTLTRMGVSGRMFLLVPAYPGCPGQTAVKWLLLFLLLIVADTAHWPATPRIKSTWLAIAERLDNPALK